LNIGVSKNANEIISNGRATGVVKATDPTDGQKFTIPKNTTSITLYLSYTGMNGDATLKKPSYMANESDLAVFLSGELAGGGKLTSTPGVLELTFACQPFKKSKTDIAIELGFNNTMFSLFLAKECDTVEEIEEYFTILYAIYWILLFLIFAFIFVVIYFYLKNNDISLYDLFERARETMTRKYNTLRGNNSEGPYHDTSLQEYPKKRDYGGL
jgi:hypothetical protein